MLKGDISNDMPKRVLVNLEPLIIKDMVVTTGRFRKKKTIARLRYDKFLLNKLFMYSTRNNLNLELIAFDMDDDQLELIYNEIEAAGLNPFRFWNTYKSPRKLASDLPYRPEVMGVIDIEENRLTYGKWALDF